MSEPSITSAPVLRRVVAILALALVVGWLPVTSSHAVEVGNEAACTPGYWKNHTDNWIERIRDDGSAVTIPTDTTLGSVFDIPEAYAHLADDTFLEALNYDRFRGDEGQVRKLLKHAVAAYLNAAYDDDEGNLKYPLRRMSSTEFYPDFNGIIAEVNDALASGDTTAILDLKDFLDGIANDLECPL